MTLRVIFWAAILAVLHCPAAAFSELVTHTTAGDVGSFSVPSVRLSDCTIAVTLSHRGFQRDPSNLRGDIYSVAFSYPIGCRLELFGSMDVLERLRHDLGGVGFFNDLPNFSPSIPSVSGFGDSHLGLKISFCDSCTGNVTFGARLLARFPTAQNGISTGRLSVAGDVVSSLQLAKQLRADAVVGYEINRDPLTANIANSVWAGAAAHMALSPSLAAQLELTWRHYGKAIFPQRDVLDLTIGPAYAIGTNKWLRIGGRWNLLTSHASFDSAALQVTVGYDFP
jgi:hypothetical protein